MISLISRNFRSLRLDGHPMLPEVLEKVGDSIQGQNAYLNSIDSAKVR